MKFFVIFLCLFAFEVSLAQEGTQKSITSEDGEVKYDCPKDPDMDTVKKMIENYIEADKRGHMFPPDVASSIKKECLAEPLPYPYKVVIPEHMIRDNSRYPKPFFVTHHEIKNIEKSKMKPSKFSADYIAEVEIRGKDLEGNRVEFTDRVFFAILKGEEAEYLGCVARQYGLGKPFIYERCYNKDI